SDDRGRTTSSTPFRQLSGKAFGAGPEDQLAVLEVHEHVLQGDAVGPQAFHLGLEVVHVSGAVRAALVRRPPRAGGETPVPHLLTVRRSRPRGEYTVWKTRVGLKFSPLKESNLPVRPCAVTSTAKLPSTLGTKPLISLMRIAPPWSVAVPRIKSLS